MSQSSSPIDRAALQHGLAQILKCYSSSGVKRFNQKSDVSVPESLLQMISSAVPQTDADQALPDQAQSHQSQSAQSQSARAPSDLVPLVAGVGNSGPQTLADPGPKSAQPAAKLQGLLPQEDSEPLPVVPWQLPDLPDDQRRIKLDALEEQVKACRKCTELVCYRRQTVFGEGLIRPKVCFFGEAPGADEDAQGRPFVGAAGRLLNDIIRAMRLTREEVYILNSLKCRPPQNRTPLPEEIANCRPFALTQLEILQPQFIILLGAVAVRSVLQTDDSVGRLRGRFHQFHGARVVVTYHPAYLLRTPEAKKLVWSDVQMVMRELGLI